MFGVRKSIRTPIKVDVQGVVLRTNTHNQVRIAFAPQDFLDCILILNQVVPVIG